MVSESKILPELLQHQAGLGKQNHCLCVYSTPAKCSRAAPSCLMKKFFTLIYRIFYKDYTKIGNPLIYSLNSGGFGMGVSQVCHFSPLQQGLQKCSHIPWASCNLSSSSNMPSRPCLL